MSRETETPGAFERSAVIFMALVCAISLLALSGWLLNHPILASLRPEYIPMPPSTALLFLGLCSTWLIQRVSPARRGIKILVQAGLLGILLIVFILALRYFTGLGPDLEKLLYPAPPLFGRFSSGRMSPLSALGFFLAIPALLFLTAGKPGTRTKSASAALSLALLIFSSLICLGYLYRAPLFYGGTLIPMAVTSAISFLFLSLGLLLMAGPACWPTRRYVGPSLHARLMRVFIPASVFIALFQGLLSTANDPWIINPAVKAAVAAFVACLIFVLLVSLIANNLSSDIERGRKAEEALARSEAELRALFASMHDLVLVIDRAGVYIKIAPTNPGLLVKPPQNLLGKVLRDVFPPEQTETLIGVVQKVLATKETAQIEYDLIIGDRTVWFEASISPMTEDSTLWVAHDITKRKHSELLQNAIYKITQATITSEGIEALYHSIHSILGELIPVENFFIALYDPVNKFISFPYFVDQFDQQPSAPTKLQGPTGYVIRTGNPLLATREIFDRLVQQGEFQAIGTVAVDWMGAPLKVEGRVIGVMAVKSYTQEIHFDQEDLKLLEFVSFQAAQAIERKRMEEEIRTLSLMDELTGLYNRRGFTLLGEHEMKLAHREKRTMLLFFGDVDDLKMINDTLGHAEGDLALQEVSAILKNSFREADILARFGGDEFVVLAVDASLECADILTNRIRAALEAHNQQADRPYKLSISTGIVRYDPETPCTMSELIAQADGLMYTQKQARNGK